MVKVFSILAIFATAMLLSSSPWLAGLAYAAVSIVQPQFVWFWAFENFPVFKITAGLAIIACLLQMMRGSLHNAVYKEPIVICLVALWLIFQASSLFTPYPSYFSGASADVVMDTLDIIVLMFLVVVGLLDNRRALQGLAIIFIVAIVYYTWWSNHAYLTNDFGKFVYGRLNGPLDSPYKDGNTFSILFVVGMPFVLFGVFYFKQPWIKLGLILAIPLIWHALVLCASRGALISTAAATLAAASLIRSRSLNVMLLVGFVVFMIYQGGPMIQRSLGTVEKTDADVEAPINPRIASWQVGWNLVKTYPLLGAGPQRFQTASRALYPGKSPHVAHNTFLNFSANTGLVAGLIYLYFFRRAYKIYHLNKAMITEDGISNYINRAGSCALVGYFVGALFLDLIIFEPFYFVLLLVVANHHLLLRESRIPTPQ